MLFPHARTFLAGLHVDCFRVRGLLYSPLLPDDLGDGSLGWVITTSDGVEVRYILPQDAPFGQPIVFLQSPDPQMTIWRNVEADGRMCLFPPGADKFPLLNHSAVLHVLDAVISIITAHKAENRTRDVILERQRWISQTRGCWSLIAPDAVPCDGVATKVRDRWVLGMSKHQVKTWITQAGRDFGPVVDVAARWVDSFDSIPHTYEQLSGDDLRLVNNDGILLYLHQTDAEPLGFAIKLAGDRSLVRLRVDRADKSWLHDRGGSGLKPEINSAHVAIVGCGSLGGAVAELLAKSGFGKLSLIDHDILKWDNVARHTLGGDDVGKSKVESLARKIRAHLPTIDRIQTYPTKWEQVAVQSPGVLNCDVIVSTIAGWPDEMALAEWARRRGIPLVLGWIEGHAIAGHAVALQGGCLGCNFSPAGGFRRAASRWPNTSPLKYADACHENYLPYGFADILPVQSMIVALATDVVLGRIAGDIHYCRLPNVETLEQSGASASADFDQLHRTGRLAHRYQEVIRDWPKDPHCWYCSS